jgi:hypothetical protein
MATNTPKAQAADAQKKQDAFDWSKFVPADVNVADATAIGGLTPIYAPDVAFKNGWDPVVGYPVRTQFLPEQVQGSKTFNPWMIHFVLHNPNKGVVGKRRDGRTEVDVGEGESLFVPLSGNLSNNDMLLLLANDPKNVSLIGLRIKGQKQVNDQPSPMWEYEVIDFHKTLPRSDRQAMILQMPDDNAPEGAVDPAQLTDGRTANGTAYSRQTGEIRS